MPALLAILFSCPALAEVKNPNPNLTISIIGPGLFNVSGPGQEIPGRFAVRLVDPQGNPLQGLTVTFDTSVGICPPLLPGCVPPPQALYGHFTDGDGENVLTDANGIARSGTYLGGTVPGQYEVAGIVFHFASARNAEVLGTGGDPESSFTIYQFAPALVAGVPALGAFPLIALALAVALVSFSRINRYSHKRETKC